MPYSRMMADRRQQSGTAALAYQSTQILKDQTLGIGSYGAVYKAQSGDLVCAAKILHRTLFDLNQLPAQPGKDHRLPFMRFEQECEFMRFISHPNVVQYLGTCQDPESGLPALLMELMDRSLTSYLESCYQPLPHHIQVNLTHDVALALSFLHSNNIIHRDLSSNNVLLIGTVRAKVTDFGMARLNDLSIRGHGTSTMCPGTDVYMPPEVMGDRPRYNEKIDCFSFGVIIIQTITRQFPDPGDRQIEVSDSRYPRALKMNIPEIDRRQNHISQVDAHHPLLPIALDCFKDRDAERPTAHELCERIITLKSHFDYRESVQADRSTERSLRQLVIQQEQMLQSQVNQLQEVVDQRDREILHKDKTIASNEHANSQLRRRLQQCSETIQRLEREKSEVTYDKDEQLEHLQEQLRTSKMLIERQRSEIRQQSTQSSVVRTEKYSKVTPMLEFEDSTSSVTASAGGYISATSRFESVDHHKKFSHLTPSEQANRTERETERRSLRHQIQDLQEMIQLQRDHLNEKDKIIVDGDNTISARQEENQRLRQQLQQHREEAQRLRQRIQEVVTKYAEEMAILAEEKDDIIDQKEKELQRAQEDLQISEKLAEDFHRQVTQLEMEHVRKQGKQSQSTVPTEGHSGGNSDIEPKPVEHKQYEAAVYSEESEDNDLNISGLSSITSESQSTCTVTSNEDLHSLQSMSYGFSSFSAPPSESYQEAKTRALIPFLYHHLLECDSSGGKFTIMDHDISLRFPAGAVPEGIKLHVEIAVTLYGPFNFPDGTQPISPIVWLCFLEDNVELQKPFHIIVPHFLNDLTRQKIQFHEVKYAKASHHTYTVQDGYAHYNFHSSEMKLPLASSSYRSYGVITTQHCCFYCILAKYTPQLAIDASYCLARIECLAPRIPLRSEIHYAGVFFLDTCLRALEEQFSNEKGYSVGHYHTFKFKECENRPHIKVIIPQHDQFIIAAEPQSAKIKASDINFWGLSYKAMRDRHRTKVYPPRVMLTVVMTKADPSPSAKLPFKFIGSTDDNDLDVELMFPLEPSSSSSRTESAAAPTSIREPQSHVIICEPPSLRDCLKKLLPLSDEWENIGTLLGVSDEVLRQIARDNDRVSNRLRVMLSEWVKQINPPPTWAELADAVEEFDKRKANEIRKKCVDNI